MKRLLTRTWLTIKHFAQRTYRNVRALGWFWGMFAVFISGVIFYSPAIVCVVIFGVTGNAWYLGLATTYVVWWFSPLFSPALLVYFALLGGVIAIINKIGMALRRRENKRWEHEKTTFSQRDDDCGCVLATNHGIGGGNRARVGHDDIRR